MASKSRSASTSRTSASPPIPGLPTPSSVATERLARFASSTAGMSNPRASTAAPPESARPTGTSSSRYRSRSTAARSWRISRKGRPTLPRPVSTKRSVRMRELRPGRLRARRRAAG
ncbi:hypothetical protein ACLESD_14080 [Pyxidicoccus sp. 3LFB2]